MKPVLKTSLRILLILFVVLNLVGASQAYHFTHFYDEPPSGSAGPGELSAWDKARAALVGIRFPKSRNLIEPDSACKTVYMTTSDHIRLQGWYFASQAARGTVIMFHGHGSSKSKLLHESDYMRSLGFNTLLVDFRAHGGSQGHVCTIGYRESADIKAAYDLVRARGENHIVLWGISLGAATILKAIHDYPDLQPDRLILEMPFGSLLQAVRGRMRTMGLPEEPLASLLAFWGGTEQGFWAFSYSPCDYAKDIRCPVLLQWGALDNRVSRQEIQCIYGNLASPQKKLVIYQRATHESLYGREHEKWRREIAGFLYGG